jgi:hypothetical protein
MSNVRVDRPVVRSFTARFAPAAAAHVRAGGHAVVWGPKPRVARLVVRKPRKGDEEDLGYWSMLDLEQDDYVVPRSGPLAGLAVLRVTGDSHGILRDRVERDSVHPGPTRRMSLDCLACGSCCRRNQVILEDEDVERFERAGRGELARRPYAKHKDGRLQLVLRKDGDCKHLARDNRCGIYRIRPEACSTFPIASECCLSAREDELGIVDGASPR